MNIKTVIAFVAVVALVDLASASRRRNTNNNVRMRNVLERCVDSHGRRGTCQPPCICDDKNAQQSSCANRKVCCVESENCEKGLKDACLIHHQQPGICLSHCGYEESLDVVSEHGDCSYGLYCCNPYISIYYDYYKEYQLPRGIGRACESEGGDGICSPTCGYGTFDGGETSYCYDDQHCCVIDYRPPVGKPCHYGNGYYGPAACSSSDYCHDKEPSNEKCFQGATCCKKLPLYGEPCDLGYGKYGTCIYTNQNCDHDYVYSCSYGTKCC